MNRKAVFLLQALRMRRKDFERQRDEAIESAMYSKIAGYDGIATGIIIAERLIEQEYSRKRHSPQHDEGEKK